MSALVYSSVAGKTERNWIGSPVVFTAFGLFVGPVGSNILSSAVAANRPSEWLLAGLPQIENMLPGRPRGKPAFVILIPHTLRILMLAKEHTLCTGREY